MVPRIKFCRPNDQATRKEGTTTSNNSNYAFNVGLVVGGSITVPDLRRAVDRLDECGKQEKGRRN